MCTSACMDLVYWDASLQTPWLPSVSYTGIDRRTRGERGDCTPGCFRGCLWARNVGCCVVAVQRDVKEGVSLGNTGSLLAAAASSPSLYSKEIPLFSL